MPWGFEICLWDFICRANTNVVSCILIGMHKEWKWYFKNVLFKKLSRILWAILKLCHEHISLELPCSEANRSSPLHFNTCGALFFTCTEWSVELIAVSQPIHSTKKHLKKSYLNSYNYDFSAKPDTPLRRKKTYKRVLEGRVHQKNLNSVKLNPLPKEGRSHFKCLISSVFMF